VGQGLPLGTHACCQFSDRDDKRRVVADFVLDGLQRGHRVAYYSRDGATSLLAAELGAVSVKELAAEGRLVVGSGQVAYFTGGDFDGPARAAGFARFAEQTVAEGYPGLSVYADNGWMPAALPDPAAWLDYELRISHMVPDYPLIGLCGFDASDRTLSAELVDAIHPVNVGRELRRPTNFHLSRIGDAIALSGELDNFTLDDLKVVLTAAAPLLREYGLSLSGVTFTDAACAAALFNVVQEVSPEITDVSPAIAKVWRLLGMNRPG